MDLNLLVVLRHLLSTHSAARTAKALGLTASAVSHALARLRRALGDELFVRSRDGLTPTARARELAPVLEEALGQLELIVASPTFDASRASLTYRLAIGDFGARATLPLLLRELSTSAPGIELVIRPLPVDSLGALETGELDAMIGLFESVQPSLFKRRLLTDHLVVIARKGHPAIRKGKITLTDYLAYGHVQVSPRGLPGSPIDEQLRTLGYDRRIVVRVPDFMLAPMLAAETDLLVTASHHLAAGMQDLLDLTTAPVPMAAFSFTVSLVWHARSHQSPAHRWMRELLVQAYTQCFAARGKSSISTSSR